MSPYRDNDEALAALVEDRRVHRDVYIDPELFELERERLFAATWQYVGHASEVPATGDYRTLDLAGKPLLMMRQPNGEVGVFYNRCAHKGAQLYTDEYGNAGRFIRCPYHAWTYRLDGAPLGVPLKAGYECSGLAECESGQGLGRVAEVRNYRDFIFARLAPQGPGFEDYFGPALQSIDDLVDRSPEGRLTVAGGVLRNLIRCNWKMYLENINDTVHPVSTHESAAGAAQAVWAGHEDEPHVPMAIEQILPFGSSYTFFEDMGGRIHPNGHSVLGTRFSIHSGYAQLDAYETELKSRLGEERADQVLRRAPQNAVLFPGLALKSSPQILRVIRPLAVDLTLIEAWAFRVEGAPDLLFERSLQYNRLTFSPMSIVAHDDVHLFESLQKGLCSGGNPWVSLHRGWKPDEFQAETQDTGGTNEILMRNQFRAWARWMRRTPCV
jgi:phenylpropionate dioxygenase-like ring-hydroxylating dioxygenase large terminal subunit